MVSQLHHPDTHKLSKDDVAKKLRHCFSQFQKKYYLLVVILPNNESQLYNQIKQLGDIEFGISTICVLANKFYDLSKKYDGTYNSAPYYANVALKVNIKNGGINQVLGDDQLSFIGEEQTMVIGIDVTHPSPGSLSNATSVAAMVASSDRYLARWPAEIRINPARQEKVDTLTEMLCAHLIRWANRYGMFPENLLVYRDGVSEGQYQMVLEEELPQLRAACKSVYKKQTIPCITLIVVGKRHHTRFYRTSKPTGKTIDIKANMDGNPQFGTVSVISYIWTTSATQ